MTLTAMRSRPVFYRSLALAEWIADDLRFGLTLARHPRSYARWYSTAQEPRLRSGRRVWVIATGLAQLYIALPLIDEVRRLHPHAAFVVSVASRNLVAFAASATGANDIVTYAPLPLSPVLARALAMVRPVSLVMVGQMFSHNLLWLAHRRGVPTAWIAAEMSGTTQQRWETFWTRFAVDRSVGALDVICANTAADRDRLVTLGFPVERVRVAGPAKFDAAAYRPRELPGRAILQSLGIDGSRPIVLGGSIVAGEDETLLDACATLKARFPNLMLILAPRDLGRVDDLERATIGRGLTALRLSRRAGVTHDGACADVLLVDTIGHLRGLYGCATVVFVGRSLAGGTGSNLMEPAAERRPIIVGPSFNRFEEELNRFLSADAVLQIGDSADLQRTLAALLSDADLREGYGRRAYEVVTANTGALRRIVDELDRRRFFASG